MSDRSTMSFAKPPNPADLLAPVAAVVLTFRRPRLATGVVRALVDVEGLEPARVTVVVNGSGGLDDPELEAAVTMVRLPRNVGPAGGFRAGMEAAFADPSVRWVYLCEDDVGLFALPSPRLADVVARAQATEADRDQPLGAIVAYGRTFVGRGAHTVNAVPARADALDLSPVDVASWGATLLSRAVFDAGIRPDAEWFFGLEDFDFFWRVNRAGFRVLVDGGSARAVSAQQTTSGRDEALREWRPTDSDEAWRAYYHARNSIHFARRYGRPSWYLWHLAYSTSPLAAGRILGGATGHPERTVGWSTGAVRRACEVLEGARRALTARPELRAGLTSCAELLDCSILIAARPLTGWHRSPKAWRPRSCIEAPTPRACGPMLTPEWVWGINDWR